MINKRCYNYAKNIKIDSFNGSRSVMNLIIYQQISTDRPVSNYIALSRINNILMARHRKLHTIHRNGSLGNKV